MANRSRTEYKFLFYILSLENEWMRSKNKGFIQFKSQENIVHYSRQDKQYYLHPIFFVYLSFFSSSSSFFSRIEILFYIYLLYSLPFIFTSSETTPLTTHNSHNNNNNSSENINSCIPLCHHHHLHSLQLTAHSPCIYPFTRNFNL